MSFSKSLIFAVLALTSAMSVANPNDFSAQQQDDHLQLRSASNPIIDAIKGGVTNAEQTIGTLIHQVASNDGHPAADAVSALITGLDSQIDNVINLVATTLGPLTFGVSNLVGDAILGPVFQSITNGAEVVVSNLVGGTVDLVTQPVIQLFVHTLSRAVEVGKKNNVKNIAKLEVTVQKLDDISKAKAVASSPGSITTSPVPRSTGTPALNKGNQDYNRHRNKKHNDPWGY